MVTISNQCVQNMNSNLRSVNNRTVQVPRLVLEEGFTVNTVSMVQTFVVVFQHGICLKCTEKHFQFAEAAQKFRKTKKHFYCPIHII